MNSKKRAHCKTETSLTQSANKRPKNEPVEHLKNKWSLVEEQIVSAVTAKLEFTVDSPDPSQNPKGYIMVMFTVGEEERSSFDEDTDETHIFLIPPQSITKHQVWMLNAAQEDHAGDDCNDFISDILKIWFFGFSDDSIALDCMAEDYGVSIQEMKEYVHSESLRFQDFKVDLKSVKAPIDNISQCYVLTCK